MLKTFVFIDVWFVKQENLKMKTKKDLREQGFELQIFSNFLAMIWIFIGSEGAEIKSRQAS